MKKSGKQLTPKTRAHKVKRLEKHLKKNIRGKYVHEKDECARKSLKEQKLINN